MSSSGREPWDANDPYPEREAEPQPVTLTLTTDEDAMMALAQLCKRFGASHAISLANAFDGGAEGENMLRGIDVMRKALAEIGYAPR
jgi:hypothetical protein